MAVDAICCRSHDYRIRCVSCRNGELYRTRCSCVSSVGIGDRFLFGDVESKRGALYVDEAPDGSSPEIAGWLNQRLPVLRVKEVLWCVERNRMEEGKQEDEWRARKVVLVCTT